MPLIEPKINIELTIIFGEIKVNWKDLQNSGIGKIKAIENNCLARISKGEKRPGSKSQALSDLLIYTTPCAFIASATLRNPAIFAPAT